jgi:hypothetical protein
VDGKRRSKLMASIREDAKNRLRSTLSAASKQWAGAAAGSMLSFMTFQKPRLAAAGFALFALVLTGCSAPHDLTVTESCKQWKQLKRGAAWTDEVKDDLRAAAPRMHEAVAKQVQSLRTETKRSSQMSNSMTALPPTSGCTTSAGASELCFCQGAATRYLVPHRSPQPCAS